MSVLSRIRVPDSIQRRAELDVATGHATQVLTTSVVPAQHALGFLCESVFVVRASLTPQGPK